MEAFATLFLPTEVPGSPVAGEHAALVRCWREFAGTFERLAIGKEKTLHGLFERFVLLHADLAFSPAGLRCSLQATPEGGFCAVFLEAQNAVLLVQRENACAHVFAWEVQPDKAAVTGAAKPTRQLRPRSGTTVAWAQVEAEPFCELVAELASTELARALPHVTKAGKELHETRDVPNSLYAVELLLTSFGGEPLGPRVPGAFKKARDEIRYDGGELQWRRAPAWAALRSTLHVAAAHADCEREYKALMVGLLAHALSAAAVAVRPPSLSALKEGALKLARRLAKLRVSTGGGFAQAEAAASMAIESVQTMAMCASRPLPVHGSGLDACASRCVGVQCEPLDRRSAHRNDVVAS